MQQQQNSPSQYKTRINYQIRASEVQLIDATGTNIGTVSLTEALKRASDLELDLVEINSKTFPIIVKICDYGKLKYLEAKKLKEAKKKQKSSEQKQLEMSPTTDRADLDHKLNKAKEFLANGDRVRFLVKFKGRQLNHREIGQEKLEYCLSQLADLISGVNPIIMDGRDMSTTVSPKGK